MFVLKTATQQSVQVTQTVETVEKVPFQKMIFEKWDRSIEKRLVFYVPKNILAIFEPVVGDFCENFPSKEFFDSLVGRYAPPNDCLVFDLPLARITSSTRGMISE